MNVTQLYTPIVKGKLNDLKALGRLSLDARTKMKPMIEMVPPKASAAVDGHLERFVKYIVRYAEVGEIFVDLYGLTPKLKTQNGVDATLAGFRLLKEHEVLVTPTYGFERDDDLWEPLRKIVEAFGKGFCFRIDLDDLDDQAETTVAQIIERTSQLGLKAKDIDLLIDLRDLANKDMEELKEIVLDFLQLIPQGGSYRSIILAGSSALKSVIGIPQEGVVEVNRNELRIWAEIQRDVADLFELVYGDYGVVHPDPAESIRSKYMNAKIRYTNKGTITYFRGHGLLYPTKDYEQYHDLANKVRSSSLYMGRGFSAGDQYIDDVADRNESHGAPATWVLADMNHHLEYTAMQLEALVEKVRAEEAELEIEELFL